MKTIVAFFLRRSLPVNIAAAAAVILGAVFMMSARRVAMPEVSLDIILVQTVYPGASPEEVERNVTGPLEEEIKGTGGIQEMYSTSRRGFSSIYIELETGLDDPESAVNDIRQAVDAVQDLPELAESPRVLRLGSSSVFPALKVHVSCEQPADTHRMAEELEQRLLAIPGVSSVDLEGFREPEVRVELDPRKMAAKHISAGEVIQSISSASISYPCGNLEEGDTQIMVSLNSLADSPEDVGNITLRSNYSGYSVKVRDIARVYMDREPSGYLYRTNGRPSVNCVVTKMKSGDNLIISRETERICSAFTREKAESGVRVFTHIVDDVSDLIRNRLNVVRNNAVIGLILVIVSLFLLLNWRVAFFTAAGLPVAFGLTFIVMGMAGITINMISMVGMILVLGMLVDDAIIVAENTYRFLEKGEERLRAVTEGTHEVALPVTGTVLTTIAAFTPIFFISGIMGKFIVHMPIIVITALTASLVEAFIILPVHAYDFAPSFTGKGQKPASRVSRFSKLQDIYSNLLSRAVRNRYGVCISALLFLVIMLTVFFGYMWKKFELFPSEGIDIFFITFQKEAGTTKEATATTGKLIEDIAVRELGKDELKDIVTRIGSDRTMPNDTVFNEGEEYGAVVVYLNESTKRTRSANEIIDVLRPRLELLVRDGSAVSYGFERYKPGPPQGKPIAVQIIGEDFETAGRFARDIEEFLEHQEGVYDIKSGFGRTVKEIEVDIQSTKARRAGITAESAGIFLRAAFEGVEASSVRRGEEQIDIRVSFPEGWAENRGAIRGLLIENRAGTLIPLERVASIRPRDTMQAIFHKQGRRFIEISPDFNTETVKAKELSDRIAERFADSEQTYPGCVLEQGGEAGKTNESVKDLARSGLAALFLIFVILTAIFNSPFHPFLVMWAVPFGFAGIVLAFLIHGEIFTFVGIIGVIGMTGVVVNDAIVLVSYIKSLRDQGAGKRESIIQGGKTRLRPVILTSLTTLLGLAPTAYNIGGKDPYLPVIALAVGWGLFFATGVTLVLIPCLYAVGDDIGTLVWRIRERRAYSSD